MLPSTNVQDTKSCIKPYVDYSAKFLENQFFRISWMVLGFLMYYMLVVLWFGIQIENWFSKWQLWQLIVDFEST